mgnify:CR=1 FL=1
MTYRFYENFNEIKDLGGVGGAWYDYAYHGISRFCTN